MKYLRVICFLCFSAILKTLDAQPPNPPCPPHLAPQMPDIQITPMQPIYCIGDNITITYMNPQNHGIVDLNWTFFGSPFTQLLNTTSTTFNITGITASGPVDFNGTLSTFQGVCDFMYPHFVLNVMTFFKANAGPDIFVSTGFPSGTIGANPPANGGSTPYTAYAWTPNVSISSVTAPNPNVNPSSTQDYELIVTDNFGCISEPDTVRVYNISALSNPNQTHYAVLKKTLDAGYYNTILSSGNQTLFFMFDEEYYKPGTTNNLNYSIVDNSNATVTVPALIKNIGENRFSLNVTTTTPALSTGAYYKLVVKNEKEEVWQTRFKVN